MNATSKVAMKQRRETEVEEAEKMIISGICMNNDEVVDTIKKIVEMNEFDEICVDDILTAFENKDYFVKPERDKEFQQYADEIITSTIVTSSAPVPCVNEGAFIILGYSLIMHYYDKEYFEEQVKISRQPSHDKERLKVLLNQLSKEDVINYYILILGYKVEKRLFLKHRDSIALNAELNEKCCEIDNSVASMGGTEYAKYIQEKTPLYFGQYLSKETIIDILCKHINKHVIMAENMAETFCNCGYESAAQYPEMVLSLQKTYPQAKILM